MPQVTFSVCNNLAITNQGVTGNGPKDVYVSALQSNQFGLPAMRMVVQYTNLLPASGSFNLTAVIDSPNAAGIYFPIAYQFGPLRNLQEGTQRILILGPAISTFDTGIDDNMWAGEQTVARISRQQGRVAVAGFRVRVVLYEGAFGTANAFQGVTLSVYGDLNDD